MAITWENAKKVYKSFDSIKRITEGLGTDNRTFHMMGIITGKDISKDMLDKKK